VAAGSEGGSDRREALKHELVVALVDLLRALERVADLENQAGDNEHAYFLRSLYRDLEVRARHNISELEERPPTRSRPERFPPLSERPSITGPPRRRTPVSENTAEPPSRAGPE
jgi:hypothetical protein